jgi:hypothetical protein
MTTPVVLAPGLGPESYATTLAHPDLAKALVLVAPAATSGRELAAFIHRYAGVYKAG